MILHLSQLRSSCCRDLRLLLWTELMLMMSWLWWPHMGLVQLKMFMSRRKLIKAELDVYCATAAGVCVYDQRRCNIPEMRFCCWGRILGRCRARGIRLWVDAEKVTLLSQNQTLHTSSHISSSLVIFAIKTEKLAIEETGVFQGGPMGTTKSVCNIHACVTPQ